MAGRKIQSIRRYILSLIIGTLIFVLGFILSYSFSYLEYSRISSIQGESSYAIFLDKLNYSFFNNDPCLNSSFLDISEDLGFQGRIIDDLENKFGKNDERVLFRKQFYTLIELEHFEFVKLLNEKCRKNINTVLFFYSNEAGDVKKSEDVGKLLGAAVGKRENSLKVYSFDINLDSELIVLLKERYDVEKSPTLIINEKDKINEVNNIQDIEKYL